MKQINVGIIGTGWCGGIRAETCATNPVVGNLHIAENRPERLAEVAKATGAKTATSGTWAPAPWRKIRRGPDRAAGPLRVQLLPGR